VRSPDDAGFSLVELLVAALITLIVVGSALGLMNPAQRVFQAQPEASDLHQRVRVGVDAIRRDLVMAGAGTYAGPAAGALTYFIPPLMPYRAFGAAADPPRGVRFRNDAISFMYVPTTPSQTWLATGLAAGALDLDLAVPPNCPASTSAQVCGLSAGDRLLVFDEAGTWDLFTVDQVAGGLVRVQYRGAQPAASYPAGATVAEVEAGTYYFKDDPAQAISQLVRYDGWVTDLPVVDDVVGLEFRYFGEADPPRLASAPLGRAPGPWTSYGPAPPMAGVSRHSWPPGESCTFMVASGLHVPRLATLGASGTLVELAPQMLTDGPWCPDSMSPNRFDADLLRVRRVHVSLRVQSALASLRGPAGALFSRGGTARAGDRYVPDLAVQFDVTPRNMNLGR
jgi:hypothetical protein